MRLSAMETMSTTDAARRIGKAVDSAQLNPIGLTRGKHKRVVAVLIGRALWEQMQTEVKESE